VVRGRDAGGRGGKGMHERRLFRRRPRPKEAARGQIEILKWKIYKKTLIYPHVSSHLSFLVVNLLLIDSIHTIESIQSLLLSTS
jgi:hypothetical protein